MALIRQALAQSAARDAIVLDLGDLVRQGDQLKARAQAQADQILADARTERDRLIKGTAEEGRCQGHVQGLEEGRKQGEAAGRQAALVESKDRIAKLDSGWSAALESFSAQRDQMLLEARQDVLRLALIAAELVTKRAIAARPETVTDQLAAILGLLVRPTRLTLHVHPDDLAIAREALPALGERFAAAAHAEVIADASLDRGSVIARSAGGGAIDASIRTQLDRIVSALLPEPPAPPPAPPADTTGAAPGGDAP